MTPRESYQEAIKEIREAIKAGHRIAGSIRAEWLRLAPALDARLVSSTEIADDLDLKPNTVKKVIARIRKEQASRPAPSRARSPVEPEEMGEERSPEPNKTNTDSDTEEEDDQSGGLMAMYQQNRKPDGDSVAERDSKVAREFESRRRTQQQKLADKYGRIDNE